MSGPCLTDTETIELGLSGSPGSLEASVRNNATTFSGTLGDDTTHNVNDHDTPHTLSQTFSIENGPAGAALTASAAAQGIIVVAINPIWVFATNDVSITLDCKLLVGGVLMDERDTSSTGIDIPATTTQLLSPGSLVSQFDIGIGDAVSVEVEYVIENIGSSGQWSFRFGGSKLVATLGY
jgi:hypothetical protein